MTTAFSWQNSISLCPASFHIPRPNLPVTPGVSWLPTFAFQSPIMKRTSFLVLVLKCMLFCITETKLYRQPNYSPFYFCEKKGDGESKTASQRRNIRIINNIHIFEWFSRHKYIIWWEMGAKIVEVSRNIEKMEKYLEYLKSWSINISSILIQGTWLLSFSLTFKKIIEV